MIPARMFRKTLVLAVVVGMAGAAVADDEVLVMADKPGGKRTLQPVAKGAKPREVADGAVGVFDPDATVPDEMSGVKIDGIVYSVPRANLCAVSGPKRADGAMWLECNQSQGDFMHADLWYAPTLAKRVKIVDGASEIQGFWAPTPTAASVLVADETAYVIDPTTSAVTKIDGAGAPSWDAAGVLHYRTLDGRVWKLVGGKQIKLGKGKRGRRSTGDLNSGIEPTRWPTPVTFKKNGKPAWK